METVYDAAGGLAGLTRLAHAWHERMLTDPLGAHPFSHGFREDHSERLAAYWAEVLGGPATYTSGPAAYDQDHASESEVVRLHSGNGHHTDLDQVAIDTFDAALGDVGYTGRLKQTLHDYWAWATTGPMAQYPDSPDEVPDDLEMPRWGWDGLMERMTGIEPA